MLRYNSKIAMKHLEKARELFAKSRSPLKKMTQAQLLRHLRKTREELWEEEHLKKQL